MTTLNDRGNQALESHLFLRCLGRVATLHYPRLLSWALPSALKDKLRETRGRILARLTIHRSHDDNEFTQPVEDALASASLSIIVPVHDQAEVTRRCLLSLQRYAPQGEIILVDDASLREETISLLDEFSNRNNWMLIRNRESVGHSGACNLGAGKATRPYLCLLNSDTVITPWCWRPIVQAFQNDPQIGAAGPSSSFAGESQTLPLACSMRFSMNDHDIFHYAKRLLHTKTSSVLTDLPWISGFAFFVRRSLWEQLDGFDRDLPDYGNDVELSMRILETGHRIVWVRTSYIHHFGSLSYGNRLGDDGILARMHAAGDHIRSKFAPSKG